MQHICFDSETMVTPLDFATSLIRWPICINHKLRPVSPAGIILHNRKRETIACHFKNLGIAKHLIMWNTRNTLTQGVLPGRQEDIRERAFYASGPLSKIWRFQVLTAAKSFLYPEDFSPPDFAAKIGLYFLTKKCRPTQHDSAKKNYPIWRIKHPVHKHPIEGPLWHISAPGGRLKQASGAVPYPGSHSVRGSCTGWVQMPGRGGYDGRKTDP